MHSSARSTAAVKAVACRSGAEMQQLILWDPRMVGEHVRLNLGCLSHRQVHSNATLLTSGVTVFDDLRRQGRCLTISSAALIVPTGRPSCCRHPLPLGAGMCTPDRTYTVRSTALITAPSGLCTTASGSSDPGDFCAAAQVGVAWQGMALYVGAQVDKMCYIAYML